MTFEERRLKFDEIVSDILTPNARQELINKGFLHAPASTKYHGNYEGGLFDHSFEVTTQLIKLTKMNNLKWSRNDSPLIIGMFHDLCKIDSYRSPIVSSKSITDNDGRWEYNSDTLLKGHGDKSVMLLSEFISLTEEEILCIRYHMGAFTDKDEWQNYTRAIHKYPNVLWTHHADMLASHVKGV